MNGYVRENIPTYSRIKRSRSSSVLATAPNEWEEEACHSERSNFMTTTTMTLPTKTCYHKKRNPTGENRTSYSSSSLPLPPLQEQRRRSHHRAAYDKLLDERLPPHPLLPTPLTAPPLPPPQTAPPLPPLFQAPHPSYSQPPLLTNHSANPYSHSPHPGSSRTLPNYNPPPPRFSVQPLPSTTMRSNAQIQSSRFNFEKSSGEDIRNCD